MTLKEIANLCGFKSTKTLLNWIKKNNDGQKMTEIGQKLTIAQQSKKPAEFDLDEVITIIRAGGNDTLANLLLDNYNNQLDQQYPVIAGDQNRKDIIALTHIINDVLNNRDTAIYNKLIDMDHKIGIIAQGTYQLQQIEISKNKKEHDEKIENIRKLIHLKVIDYNHITGREMSEIYNSLYNQLQAKTGHIIYNQAGQSKLSALEEYDKINLTDYCDRLLHIIDDNINSYMAFASDSATKKENKELKQKIEELERELSLRQYRKPRQTT